MSIKGRDMDYMLMVAFNCHFNVVLCDVQGGSQTYTDSCKNMEKTKSTGDHNKWNDN